MNNNGLDISEDEFCRMSQKDQNLILFRNIVFIRKQFKDYSLTKKIQYVWLSILTTAFFAWLGIKQFFLGG